MGNTFTPEGKPRAVSPRHVELFLDQDGFLKILDGDANVEELVSGAYFHYGPDHDGDPPDTWEFLTEHEGVTSSTKQAGGTAFAVGTKMVNLASGEVWLRERSGLNKVWTLIADWGANLSGLDAADIDTLAKINAIITDATLIDTTDARLSDARTPTAHTHTASAISDASTDGKAILTSASYALIRGLLDLEAGTDFYSKTAADAAFATIAQGALADTALQPATLVGTGGAALVGITDAGDLYDAATVEAALAEVKAIADAAGTGGGDATVAGGLKQFKTGGYPVTAQEFREDVLTNALQATGTGKAVFSATPTLTDPTFTGVVSIPDNTITNAMMADDAVDTDEIAANAITKEKLADNAVGTAEIVNRAVTIDKIVQAGGTIPTAGNYLRGDGRWESPTGAGDAVKGLGLPQFVGGTQATSEQLRTMLTDETGAGAAVFAGFGGNNPVINLTSSTNLPIATGVSGLGENIATALALNVGAVGAPVVNGGVLGTPSSATLTNATGLPISALNDNLGTSLQVLRTNLAGDAAEWATSAGGGAAEGIMLHAINDGGLDIAVAGDGDYDTVAGANWTALKELAAIAQAQGKGIYFPAGNFPLSGFEGTDVNNYDADGDPLVNTDLDRKLVAVTSSLTICGAGVGVSTLEIADPTEYGFIFRVETSGAHFRFKDMSVTVNQDPLPEIDTSTAIAPRSAVFQAAGINTATDVITTTTNHGFVTGAIVKLFTGTSLAGSGLYEGDIPYIVASATTTTLQLRVEFEWTPSGSGTGEYYLTTSNGLAWPGMTTPSAVTGGGSGYTAGTVGSLASSKYAWADNDGLGFSTLYVRVPGDASPGITNFIAVNGVALNTATNITAAPTGPHTIAHAPSTLDSAVTDGFDRYHVNITNPPGVDNKYQGNVYKWTPGPNPSWALHRAANRLVYCSYTSTTDYTADPKVIPTSIIDISNFDMNGVGLFGSGGSRDDEEIFIRNGICRDYTQTSISVFQNTGTEGSDLRRKHLTVDNVTIRDNRFSHHCYIHPQVVTQFSNCRLEGATNAAVQFQNSSGMDVGGAQQFINCYFKDNASAIIGAQQDGNQTSRLQVSGCVFQGQGGISIRGDADISHNRFYCERPEILSTGSINTPGANVVLDGNLFEFWTPISGDTNSVLSLYARYAANITLRNNTFRPHASISSSQAIYWISAGNDSNTFSYTAIASVTHASDLVTTTANHGFKIGDKVKFYAGAGSTLPGGIAPATVYYISDVPSSTTFTMSDTFGGGVFGITDAAGVAVTPWEVGSENKPIFTFEDNNFDCAAVTSAGIGITCYNANYKFKRNRFKGGQGSGAGWITFKDSLGAIAQSGTAVFDFNEFHGSTGAAAANRAGILIPTAVIGDWTISGKGNRFSGGAQVINTAGNYLGFAFGEGNGGIIDAATTTYLDPSYNEFLIRDAGGITQITALNIGVSTASLTGSEDEPVNTTSAPVAGTTGLANVFTGPVSLRTTDDVHLTLNELNYFISPDYPLHLRFMKGAWSVLSEPNVVDNETTLLAVIAAIGTDSQQVIIRSTITLTANRTVPENISLQFRNAAMIDCDDTYYLYCNGSVMAPPSQQVFTNYGTNLVKGRFGNQYRYVGWWGAKSDFAPSVAYFSSASTIQITAGSGGTLTQAIEIASVNGGTHEVTTAAVHGFTVGNRVQFSTGSGATLPGGLTAATDYYILTVPTTAKFTVSTSSGGSIFGITAAAGSGTNYVGKETYNKGIQVGITTVSTVPGSATVARIQSGMPPANGDQLILYPAADAGIVVVTHDGASGNINCAVTGGNVTLGSDNLYIALQWSSATSKWVEITEASINAGTGTDSTSAIQAAVNSSYINLPGAQRNTGTVKLSSGNYYVTDQIDLTGFFGKIVGEGPFVTSIYPNDAANFADSALFLMGTTATDWGLYNTVIQDFGMRGRSVPLSNIGLVYAEDDIGESTRIERMYASNFGASIIMVPDGVKCMGLIINDCHFGYSKRLTGNNSHNIHLGSSCYTCRISNTTINSAGGFPLSQTGIYFSGLGPLVIDGVHFEDQLYNVKLEVRNWNRNAVSIRDCDSLFSTFPISIDSAPIKVFTEAEIDDVDDEITLLGHKFYDGQQAVLTANVPLGGSGLTHGATYYLHVTGVTGDDIWLSTPNYASGKVAITTPPAGAYTLSATDKSLAVDVRNFRVDSSNVATNPAIAMVIDHQAGTWLSQEIGSVFSYSRALINKSVGTTYDMKAITPTLFEDPNHDITNTPNTIISRSGNILTTNTAHGFAHASRVMFSGADLPAPLTNYTLYYIKKVDYSTTKITVALTPDGDDIALTDNGTLPVTITKRTGAVVDITADDAITLVPNVNTIAVDTNGGGGIDYLKQIYGGYPGRRITLKAYSDYRTISVRDAADTVYTGGNIELARNAPFHMENVYDTIELLYANLKWIEVSRSKNSDPVESLTIAAGVMTISPHAERIYVSGESGAADALDTISGGYEGQQIILCAASVLFDITVKHATGNLYLGGKVDMVLDHNRDTITLVYWGGVWKELSRSNNFT